LDAEILGLVKDWWSGTGIMESVDRGNASPPLAANTDNGCVAPVLAATRTP
jgi:hypothetical protein